MVLLWIRERDHTTHGLSGGAETIISGALSPRETFMVMQTHVLWDDAVEADHLAGTTHFGMHHMVTGHHP